MPICTAVHAEGGQMGTYLDGKAVAEILDMEARSTLTEWSATNPEEAKGETVPIP